MNLKEKLRKLYDRAKHKDSAEVPHSRGKSGRFWIFGLQIAAALVSGLTFSAGTMLLLEKLVPLTDKPVLQGQKFPQVMPTAAAAVPTPPASALAPVVAIAEVTTAQATGLTAPTEVTIPPCLGATVQAQTAAVAPIAMAVPSGNADRQVSVDRQTLENLVTMVDALTLKVAELGKINSKNTKAAPAAAETVPLARSRSEEIELSIFAISPSGVLVSDKGKPRLVPPGDKLPGGMTFLNFDPVTRRMTTDQGEYVIPALTP